MTKEEFKLGCLDQMSINFPDLSLADALELLGDNVMFLNAEEIDDIYNDRFPVKVDLETGERYREPLSGLELRNRLVEDGQVMDFAYLESTGTWAVWVLE
jgi:hypothetical protein